MKPNLNRRVIGLRLFHGITVLYFTFCLFYLYFVGLTGSVNNTLFILAVFSLAIEGIAVFSFNQGNCPLIHIQQKIGDEKPFFELLFPTGVAKRAIPGFALLTIIAILIILLRFVLV